MQVDPKNFDAFIKKSGIYVVIEKDIDMAPHEENSRVICACWSYELAKAQLISPEFGKTRTIQGPITILDDSKNPVKPPVKPIINPKPRIDPIYPDPLGPNIPKNPFNPYNPNQPNGPFGPSGPKPPWDF